jgi:hypothetical protein
MSREPRPMPCGVFNGFAAEEPERLVRVRSPPGHTDAARNPFHDSRVARLLQQDQIRLARFDDAREPVLPALASNPDVVREQPERHEYAGFSNNTR